MTTYQHAAIQGHKIFYREAGSTANSTIVLLHGFPSSSHMFRELIPQLASHFHVVAPDYLGFGYSDAPAATNFPYTFDNVTAQMPAGLWLIPYGDASPRANACTLSHRRAFLWQLPIRPRTASPATSRFPEVL